MATVIFTNGRIAICKDMVFGLCVMAENGWVPLSQGTPDEMRMVIRLIDNNPTFLWKEELDRAYQDSLEWEKSALARRQEAEVINVKESPKGPTWAEVDAMTPAEYLEYRFDDAEKLRCADHHRRLDNGDIEFVNGEYVFAKAVRTGKERYDLISTHPGKVIVAGVNADAVYAEVLRRFW